MTDPPWLGRAVVLAIHDAQIAAHGGLAGVRDHGLLDSALARPRHRHAYGDPDACELAAAYGHGIIANHPFADGNKRTAFVTSVTFLKLCGHGLTAPREERVAAFLAVAAGEATEEVLAEWFRRWTAAGRP